MAKTIDELKAQANQIKNETAQGANTSQRIGLMNLDIVEKIEEERSNIDTKFSELETNVIYNLSKDGTVYTSLTKEALETIPLNILSNIRAGFVVSIIIASNDTIKRLKFYRYYNERLNTDPNNWMPIWEVDVISDWQDASPNLKIEIPAVSGMIISSSDGGVFYRISALDENGFQVSEEESGINPNISQASVIVNDNEKVKTIRIVRNVNDINRDVVIGNVSKMLIQSFQSIQKAVALITALSNENKALIEQTSIELQKGIDELGNTKMDIPKGKNLFNKDGEKVDNTDLTIDDRIIIDARFTGTGSIIKDTGYYLSPLIEVKQLTQYALSIAIGAASRLFEYDSEKSIIETPLIDNVKRFTTGQNTQFVRFNFKSEYLESISLEQGDTATPGQSYSVELLTQTDKQELEQKIQANSDTIQALSTKKEFESLLLPDVIYGLQYNENAINFINRLYPEGCFPERTKALINDGISVIVDYRDRSQSDLVAERTLPIQLSNDGYIDYEHNLVFKQTKIENARNKKIIVLCIGDSLTDLGYPAVLQAIADMHKSVYNDITLLCVGTRLEDIDIQLGDKTYHVRGCNEGRSGWAVSDYLRHAIQCRSRNGVTNNVMLVGKVAWDSLGLGSQKINGEGGREYVDFTYNEQNGELIRSTCHGYYDADPTEELWDWIVNVRKLTTFTYQSQLYTFSDSYTKDDDNKQIAAIKYLCENPDVVFYDFSTVKESNGKYAFNFRTYLDRYKTLQDDGVTRLTAGSTAGTKVIDVNAYDVCTPTHVAIIMAYNDINNVVQNSEPIADDHYMIAQLIKSYSESIQCIVGCTHRYGAFYPARWSNVGFFVEMPSEPYTSTVCKRMLELSKNQEYNRYADYLPIYHCQSIYGGSLQKSVDTLNGNMLLRNNNADGLHADTPVDFLDRAYLLISWIYSTL